MEMTGKILLARARNDTLCFTKAVRIEESTTVGGAMRIIAEKCSIDPEGMLKGVGATGRRD